MEKLQESKNISLKDMDNTLKFRIKLFDALEGLDFMDKAIALIKSEEKLSIKPFLNDLLKLCVPLKADGTPLIDTAFNLEFAGSIIRNPMTIIELGIEILKFQQVFLQGSETSQVLTDKVKSLFNTRNMV